MLWEQFDPETGIGGGSKEVASKVIGCAVMVAVCSSFALLWVYGSCMVDTSLPDPEARRIRMMFRMSDQGLLTVPALIGLVASLLFLLIASFVTLWRLFQRKG